MAKDAKGHGSEARSGHEHAIAVDTVKNPLMGVFLGGPNAAQAESNLRSKFGYSDKEISGLKGNSDKAAAASLASGPKSAPVATHPAMAPTNHPDGYVARAQARGIARGYGAGR